MPTSLQTAWRAAIHAVVPLLLVLLVKGGIHVPDSWSGLAEAGAYAAGVYVYAYVEHWLQVRTGASWWARAARLVGRLMAGGVARTTVAPAPSVTQ